MMPKSKQKGLTVPMEIKVRQLPENMTLSKRRQWVKYALTELINDGLTAEEAAQLCKAWTRETRTQQPKRRHQG